MKTKDTVVFCDLATPKQTFESYECGKNFDAYNELKCKLIEKGILHRFPDRRQPAGMHRKVPVAQAHN